MLRAFSLLLLFQLVGELLTRGFSLQIPGPVLGMTLLFLLFLWRKHIPHDLKTAVSHLLQHLSLLFIPASVGIVQQLDRVANEGLRFMLVLVCSVVITMAVSALILHWLIRNRSDDTETS